MHSIFLSYLQGGGGGDYTMKRRLSWEIQMSNSAHWEVCWCVNLVSLKQIYDTFPFFKPAMCILLQWWMLILHIARFSHFWCQHVDEYSLWAKRSGFRLLCLRPFFFILGCLWCQRQRLFLYMVIWGKRLRPSVREEQPIRTKWRNSALFLSDELSGCTKSQYQIIQFILTCESCKASKKKNIEL